MTQRKDQMNRSGNSEHAGARPAAGLAAEFAAMLSALPDAEAKAEGPVVEGAAADEQGGEEAKPRGARSRKAEDQRRMGARVARQAKPTARKRATSAESKPGSDVFDQFIEEEFNSSRGTALSAAVGPIAIPFPERVQARQTPQENSPLDERSLSRQILEELEKYNLPAVTQLRIEVEGGVVIIAGEVPSSYEKQLIGHFCRQIPGVTRFVDGMVIRETPVVTPKPKRDYRKPSLPRFEWQLPFRAWHAGAALGLIVLIWGAVTLGRGGRPERSAVHQLSGTLIFEGQPAAGASIVLYPTDPSIGVRPRASVNDDGSFEVTSYEPGDGAPAGEYKATLEWRRPIEGAEGDDVPAPNVLPAAYASQKTTPITVIVEEGENEFPTVTFQN